MEQINSLRILYVGRKSDVAENLQQLFEQQNLRVGNGHGQTVAFSVITNQKSALRMMRAQPPAALWVEMDQRSTSRIRFCETVRYRLPSMAIIAVTSQLPAKSEFTFDGLIRVPFAPQKVWETIEALKEQRTAHKLRCGPIHLDLATRTVVTPKGQYTMTPKQCALLKLLMTHHGEVVKRRQIMESVWKTSYLDDTRTLDVHIRWLRECIEANPSKPNYLKTVRGVGYCFKIL